MSAFFAQSLKSSLVRASLAGVSVALTTGLVGATAGAAHADVPDTGTTSQTGSAADLVTSGATDFDSYLTSLVQDTSGYWSDQMTSWSSTYRTGPWQPLYYRIVDSGDSVASQCTDSQGNAEQAADPDELTGADPAFFCSADMTVYLSSQWLYDHIWTSQDGGAPSDFGVAYVIAHEMGHAVQHDLGTTEPEGAATVAPTELQADCLAGVWSNAKYYQNVLDDGDIQEAVEAASSVGDYDYDQQDHHGTPAERTSAFMTGYNSGQGSSCTLDLPGSM